MAFGRHRHDQKHRQRANHIPANAERPCHHIVHNKKQSEINAVYCRDSTYTVKQQHKSNDKKYKRRDPYAYRQIGCRITDYSVPHHSKCFCKILTFLKPVLLLINQKLKWVMLYQIIEQQIPQCSHTGKQTDNRLPRHRFPHGSPLLPWLVEYKQLR